MHRIKVPGEWSRWSGYVDYLGEMPPRSEWPAKSADWFWDDGGWLETFGPLYGL